MMKISRKLKQVKEDYYPPQPLPHLQPVPQPQFPPQQDIFQKLMTDAKEGLGYFERQRAGKIKLC